MIASTTLKNVSVGDILSHKSMVGNCIVSAIDIFEDYVRIVCGSTIYYGRPDETVIYTGRK